VPIRVTVTPENGPSASFDAVIQMASNPASTNVAVTIPVGPITRIYTWTR